MSKIYTVNRRWDYFNRGMTVHYPFKKGDQIAVGSSARSLPEGVEMVKREVIDAGIAAGTVVEEESDDAGQAADAGAGQAQSETDEAPRGGSRRARPSTP